MSERLSLGERALRNAFINMRGLNIEQDLVEENKRLQEHAEKSLKIAMRNKLKLYIYRGALQYYRYSKINGVAIEALHKAEDVK